MRNETAMKRKLTGAGYLLLGIILLSFGWASRVECRATPYMFQFHDGSITVRGNGIPLDDLLARIAESAKLEIKVLHLVQPSADLNLSAIPVNEALRSILGHNYIVVHHVEHSKNRVLIKNRAKPGENGRSRKAGHFAVQYPSAKAAKNRITAFKAETAVEDPD
jgi:hypothetical protein